MFCNVTGTVINMLLDWLFIIGFHWGIQGAALATLAGEAISFFLCFRYFLRFKTFSIKWKMMVLRPGYVIRIVKLGLCGFINGMIMMFVGIVMNNTLIYYGGLSVYGDDIPLAVAGIGRETQRTSRGFYHGIKPGVSADFWI